MKNPKLKPNVCILGPAGAGKDEAAKILYLEFPGYKIDRFAAPLKNAARMVFGALFDERDTKEVNVYVSAASIIDAAVACLEELGLGYDLEHFQLPLNWCDDHAGDDRYVLTSSREFQQWLGTEFVRAIKDSAFRDRLMFEQGYIIPDCRFRNEMHDHCVFIYRPGIKRVNMHSSEDLAWEIHECVERYTCEGMAPYIINFEGRMIHILNNSYDLEFLRTEGVMLSKILKAVV